MLLKMKRVKERVSLLRFECMKTGDLQYGLYVNGAQMNMKYNCYQELQLFMSHHIPLMSVRPNQLVVVKCGMMPRTRYIQAHTDKHIYVDVNMSTNKLFCRQMSVTEFFFEKSKKKF